MAERYIPNQKHMAMFGEEKRGYCCERVDAYLAKLEGAFVQVQQDNSMLKEKLTAAKAAIPVVRAEPPKPVQDTRELTALRDKNEQLRRDNQRLKEELELQQLSAQLVKQKQTAANEGQEDRELIAQALIDARATAEQIKQAARKEAEQIVRNARGSLDAMKNEEIQTRQKLKALHASLSKTIREIDFIAAKRGDGVAQ